MRPLSLVVWCLAALPLLAQPSEPTRPGVTSASPRVVIAPAAASADDYIFVRVPTPAPRQMGVRYVVDGSLFLNEVLDLSAPLASPKHARSFRRGVVGKEADQPVRAPRKAVAVELLAMHIPQVQALREIAKVPGRVVVEISFNGKKARTATLPDLIEESAALRRTDDLTVVRSVVTGPAAERKRPDRKMRVATNEYLESCTECTSEMPCETECGWDEGKGGPVTCGEQGYCGTCPPERMLDEYWKVTLVETGTTSTPQECFLLSQGVTRWFQEYYSLYRHDYVHYKMICYDSPNCVSCWPEEQVVETYYETTTCWENTDNYCNPAQVPYYTPACSILCQYWGGCEN